MKRAMLTLVSLLAVSGACAAEPDGKLLLPDFGALGARASDSVSITLDAALLAMAASFLDGSDPQDAAVRELLAGIKGIYVRSYSFERDFAYPAGDLAAVRQQLLSPPWQQIVQVKGGKDRSSVDIFICQVQSKTRGLTVIAAEPRRFTIVNIVGAIDLDKLHKLEGRFGVPKVPAAH
jgi:uncharacterized protein DUF4252